ncbi:MAG: ABC transporter ATP-binding protein [Bacteriovoracaceae bacterium]|jgi:ABC-type lipoprotein export system ATPase subunit|nr:ABC transporter ATP-binding protein [Bacteriovoracaceae bacterium]
MNFVKVENVTKSFGVTQVLKGINLELKERSQIVLKGASGSGKSTLLYLIGGLDKPDTGKVIVAGKDIVPFKDDDLAIFRNSSIGFIFQFHFLLPSMNCLDNILLPARIGARALSDIKPFVVELAKKLGVDHLLKKYPHQISGGEQQRINIIRALSLRPKLLLCDEPTGNLDSVNSSKVVELLKSLSTAFGSALIIVTHDDAVANSFEKKITIEDGQIIS